MCRCRSFRACALLVRADVRSYIIAVGVALVGDYGMRLFTARIRYATLTRRRGNVTHVHIDGLDDGWRPGQQYARHVWSS